jgi:REP element-mobilizing transposase RayT
MAERAFDPGHYYHVGTRGNFGEPLFETPDDHEVYLKRYARVAAKYGWTTLDWCLLWNHTHFLVKLSDHGLTQGMRELNTWIARRLNAIHDQTGKGHVFRHRFSAKHVDTDGYLLEVSRYIPLNPLRAGQCERPEDWRWGGFRANLGLEYPRPFHSPPELLGLFADNPANARERYLEFVRDGQASDSHDPSSNNGVQRAT